MSRTKQIIAGLKQISQGTMRVLGLTKILSLLSPYLNTFSTNTKTGLKQIADGLKHIFGATETQRLAKWLDTEILASYDAKAREVMQPFYTNLYHYYVMEQVQSYGAKTFSPYEQVTIAKHVMDNVGATALIGVQPMSAPIGQFDHLSMVLYAPAESPAPNVDTALDTTAGRRFSLQLSKITASVGSHKLMKGYTATASDISVPHLDVKAQLLNTLAENAAEGVDSHLLKTIYDLAPMQSTLEPSDKVDGNLSIHISQHANDIARLTRRGAGNWMVLSRRAWGVLQAQSRSYIQIDSQPTTVGVLNKVGTLNHSMVIYVYADAPNDVLVGYKGRNGESDTGLFYGPYIPVTTSGVVMDPATFEPMVQLISRFALHACSEATSYYAKFNLK
jgi:hypothetical protein